MRRFWVACAEDHQKIGAVGYGCGHIQVLRDLDGFLLRYRHRWLFLWCKRLLFLVDASIISLTVERLRLQVVVDCIGEPLHRCLQDAPGTRNIHPRVSGSLSAEPITGVKRQARLLGQERGQRFGIQP
jgi:hypothetical protein